MRERGHRRRLAGMHAREQQIGLPVEQLQHLALEAAVAEGHARELAAVDTAAAGAAGAWSTILVASCTMPDLPGLYGPLCCRRV